MFGESNIDAIAAELHIPVIGKMPIDAQLADAVDKEEFYKIKNEYLNDISAVLEA